MAKPQETPPFQRVKSGQVREALDRLEDLFIDGVKHGFFRCSIACDRCPAPTPAPAILRAPRDVRPLPDTDPPPLPRGDR